MKALITALLAAACTAAPSIAGPTGPDARPPVGWCCFYPFVDVGMDALPASQASVLSVCSGGWGMGQVEGKIDFGPFDRQLDYARKHGLRLAIIQELNPVYTPAWLRAKVSAAGESSIDALDRPMPAPSLSSRTFRRAQEAIAAAFVEHVKATDTTRRVAFYHPGAEWWFPLNERYHPDDVAQFRRWLAKRYGSVAALNRTWRSSFASFDAVAAPRIDMVGAGKGLPGLAQVIDVQSGQQHCSWSTPAATDPAAQPGPGTYAAVTPGKRYRMSADVLIEDLAGPGVFLETAWVGPNGGPPVAIETSPFVRRPVRKWQRLTAVFKAPANAGRAWLLLKFVGHGSARYDNVRFTEEARGPNLAPAPGADGPGWAFQNWTGGSHARGEALEGGGPDGSACLRIAVSRSGGKRPPYRNATAAVHDWSTFWFEYGADYIDGLSALMRRLDPTRPRVTYLTMAWAAPSETDETQRSAIAPDVVGMRGTNIDAFGMQICAADRDPYRVTACLDLMRKYRKPLWAVDLVDFTSGVHIGSNAMDRITQATVQHGAAGIIYCAWHIPTVLDYSFHPYHPPAGQARMVTGAMAGIEAMRGMRVAPHGALVMPMLPATPDDPDGVRNDWRSFTGWYKLLERLHLTVDLVTLRELDAGADLGRYPWVVVPDCPALSDKALARLRGYARKGGRLVLGGTFARLDEHGIARTGPRAPAGAVLAPDLGRRHAGDPVRDTHAGNTPPLFLWNTSTAPAAAALRDARTRLANVLRVWPADAGVLAAPKGVGAVQWAGPGRRALYLVNLGTGTARGVRVRMPRGTATITVDGKPGPVQVGRDGVVRVPAFRVSCIVLCKTDTLKGKTP